MIYFGNTHADGNKPTRHYDEMWSIMRYPTKNLKCKVVNHPELAPSQDLFNYYQNVLKNNWNKRTFTDLYLPRFMAEHQDQQFKDTLNYLYKICNDKDIILMCSCFKDELCHRSIIRGMLAGACAEFKDYNKLGAISCEYTADLSYYTRWKNYDYYRRPAILVAGSRNFNDYNLLCNTLNSFITSPNTVIITGHARGADMLAERYAQERGLENISMPADWDRYGKSAGYRRNEEMHSRLEWFPIRQCICFWDGISKGTQHNFGLCEQYGTHLTTIRF